ncbi:MAG: FAD-binding protein [Gammaproteobacteria bacterium]
MQELSGEYDWIVVGSGFGGSVSALRLAEKGYRVAVLESGPRYRDEDFAKSASCGRPPSGCAASCAWCRSATSSWRPGPA